MVVAVAGRGISRAVTEAMAAVVAMAVTETMWMAVKMTVDVTI